MKHNLIYTLNRMDRILTLVLEWLCIALFAAITVILTLNIFVRFVPIMSMHWFDEILELLYAALVFSGATAVWVTHSHFSVGDWISKYLPSIRAKFVYRLFVECLSLLFIGIFFWYALQLTMHTQEETTVFAMSKKYQYVCMPISGFIMVIYSLKNMYLEMVKILNPDANIDAGKEDLNH